MADAYLQSLLGGGETIRSEARQHPMALIRFALQPILVFLGALVLLAIGSWLTPDGTGLFSDIVRWIDTLLGLLTAGMFILAILWFPLQVFRWTKRRYMVTDRRVLYVDGVLRKNSVDAGLSMITDVGFRQGVLGRSLGYGDLVVATASNRPLHFRQIRDALAFKQAIMTAQHATVEARADEILVSKGLAPTAATPAAAAPDGAAAAVPAAASAQPAAAPVPAWDGSDVPAMMEDDTPTLDPGLIGADGPAPGAAEEAVAEAPEVVAEAPEVVAEAPEVVAEAQALETHADEVSEAIESAASESAPETAEVAQAAGETAETVADTAGDVAEDAGTTIEAASDAVDEVVDATAATAEAAPESVSEVVDATAATADESHDPDAKGGYMAALDQVDSTMDGLTEGAKGSGSDSVTTAIARLAELRDSGAITAEEFDTRKQELLERL
jgi:membrane protein YdbS with pleckstrin-like domain